MQLYVPLYCFTLCTMVGTLSSGFAQAQSQSAPGVQAEEAEGEAEAVVPAPGVAANYVNPYAFYSASCVVGPRTWDVIFTCYGLGFTSYYPTAVHCQLRNSPYDTTWYPDQFACHVLSTSPGSVTVRIRRIDLDTGGSAWTQDLRLNLSIVD